MYERLPDSDEPDAFGFCAKDYSHEVVEVWPENERAWRLFEYMRTQWRVAAGGAFGLDYTPMQHKMDRMRLEAEEYEALEDDIRTMEFAAIEAMNTKD